MIRSLFAAVIFLLATHAVARPLDDSSAVSYANHVNALIDGSLKQLSALSQDFNAHVSAINKLRPFDLDNLDTSHIEATGQQVLEFTEYLKSFLATSDSMRTVLMDSLYALRYQDPNPDLQRSLEAYETSYKTDQVAFRKYVETLREVYQNVLDALLFTKSTKYYIGKTGLEFKKPEDTKRYEDFMSKIDGLTHDLQKAVLVSRKATSEANLQLQALNKLHAKQSVRSVPKTGTH